MDVNGGLRVQALSSSNSSSTPKAVSVYSIRDAGHLLMLDNWEEFNAGVIAAAGGLLPVNAPVPQKMVPTVEHCHTTTEEERKETAVISNDDDDLLRRKNMELTATE
jgi:hypothetical protein